MLRVKENPHKLSLAFAIGVFIGMSPLLGIHTILGLLVAYVFRLNKLATIVGIYITNPWTIIPIYTFSTFVGARCLGINKILPSMDWSRVTFSSLISEFEPLLLPFVVGTLIVGLVSAVIGYFIILRVVRKRNE